MNKLIAVALLLMLTTLTFAGEKMIPVKVEVPTVTEDRAVKWHGGGVIGIIRGTRTENMVFMLNAIVNDEHARLKCFEHHKGCTALGIGVYDGELKGKDLWITQTVPLSHKVERDHWQVAGSW